MASIKDLYTRADNNKVERATIGEDWIEYLGTDSDQFRAAKRKIQQDAFAGKIHADNVEAELVASLITAWSFDEPCTDENKIELMRNSPSLCEQIDRMASARANFTKPRKSGSTDTLKSGSGSDDQLTQKQKSQ